MKQFFNIWTIGIIIIVLAVLMVIGYNYWGWFGGSNASWNKKCINSGGEVKQSGKTCEYVNCDHSKYSCSMYS